MNSSYLGSFEWQRCKVELKNEQYRILSSALIFHRFRQRTLDMEKFFVLSLLKIMFNFQWLYQIYKTTFLFVVVAASLVVSQAPYF